MRNMSDRLNQLEQINEALRQDPAAFVRQCETDYFREVTTVVEQMGICAQRRILLLAGPSGSGKTTTAHILADAFRRKGIQSGIISLDDFFLGKTRTPVEENGKQNYECVEALDLQEIHTCFTKLLTQGETTVPRFDFITGEPAPERSPLQLQEGGIIIVEGLHALHPKIVSALPADQVRKLFVSVDSQVVDAEGALVFRRRQIRLMRRISRDLLYRNASVELTLSMWSDVIAGEFSYLFPHRNTVDYEINTFHPYEPALFRDILLEKFRDVDPACPHAHFLVDLQVGLERFAGLPEELVPENSLLREFIPGGIYE